MSSALVPFATLAYCLTMVCCTAVVIVAIALWKAEPSQRPPILRGLAHVVRARAEALRFWRRR
jgi:hypothetical protein